LIFSGGTLNPTASITATDVSTVKNEATYTIQAFGTHCGVVDLFVPYPTGGMTASFRIMNFGTAEWEPVVVGGTSNFEAVPKENNLDVNGGGFRIFAETNTPNGSLHNQVAVKVTMTEPVAAGQSLTVYWRIYDVDDPTQNLSKFPLEAQLQSALPMPPIQMTQTPSRSEETTIIKLLHLGTSEFLSAVQSQFQQEGR
jgi:hypothetical protein